MPNKKEKLIKKTLKTVSKKPNKESIVSPEISDINHKVSEINHKVSEINHEVSEKISNKQESPDFNNADMFTLTASSIKAIAELKSDILNLRNSSKENNKLNSALSKQLVKKYKTLAILNKKNKVKPK